MFAKKNKLRLNKFSAELSTFKTDLDYIFEDINAERCR